MSAVASSDDRLETLELRVRELTTRLDALEGAEGRVVLAVPVAHASTAPAVGRALPEQPAEPSPLAAQSVPALAGRTFVVMGGAFLIRSLTENGTVSPALGVTFGLAYAALWLLLADRAGARGQSVGGTFHALASALIVYPLLVEAPTRLALVAPATAALLLALANAAGLAVAWRHNFPLVAWIQQIAALGATVLLLFRTRSPLPFGLLLLGLAVGSLVLAYGRSWRGQRWLIAIGVDSVVALLGALRLFGRTPPSWLDSGAVLTLQVGLVAIYLGAFVLRLLVQARFVTPFAIFQTVAVLVLGFEGALLVGGDSTRVALAIAALASGALLHGQLARRSEQRFGHGPAVAYFSSVATFLAAEATRVLLPGAVAAPLWLAAAVALGALALAGTRPILQIHAALLALAGALLSGLLPASLAALARPAQVEWPAVDAAALVVLVLAAVTAALLYRGAPRGTPAPTATAARLTALVVVLCGFGGLAVRWLGQAVAAAPGANANAGMLAALRTAVLAAAAIALASGALAIKRGELVRLAWVVLALTGAKLVLEDLRVAGTTHLVFCLVLYGAALIAVPALARRMTRQAADLQPS